MTSMRRIQSSGNNERAAQAVTAELAAQLEDADAMAGLYRLAEAYARVPRDSLVVRELVWEVVEDLLTGDTPRNSEPIPAQLRAEVRRRANRVRRRARAQETIVPIEDAASALIADVEPDEPSAPEPADLVIRIREYARGDDAVQQLLALYNRGLVSRRSALHAGMTTWGYRAARERLVAYAHLAVSAASAAKPEP
jgi:hypothetical protein